MADVLNTNVFDANKKFVDLASLDYFWDKAKGYVDGVDAELSGKVGALETTVGNADAGLVKEVADLRAEVTALGDVEGGQGIGGMIDAKIAALDLPTTYEAKGEAAKAEAAAKAYADGLAKNYDAAGAAEAVDGKLTAHAADAVAHVTADERTAWNSAKTAIDAFLKDADMTEKAVDTLAELQTYMTSDGAAAAELVGRVAALEGAKDDYKAADATNLQAAKDYVDSKVDDKFDAKGSADAALAAAKADAAELYQVKGNYETAGAAAQALADAKADAEAKYQVKGSYEAAGAAAAAQAAAIAQAKADAAEALKAYYTKTEVNNLLTTNSEGDRAYAKQYTDELFGSFKFAANSDIDALFA